MADISLCTQDDCPKFTECYRNPKNHKAVEWQSYDAPEYDNNGCKYFEKIKKGKKESK